MVILSESTKNVATSVGTGLIMISIIAFIMSVILSIYGYYISSDVALTIAFIFLIVAINSSEPHKKIKAIVPDDYSAVSLYDKYIVIGREGQIWELEEREAMDEQEDKE